MTTQTSKPSRIDWQEVRERLRSSEALLAQALTTTSGQIEEAYNRRAVALASHAKEHGPAGLSLQAMTLRVMVMLLAGERYGIEVKDVIEVMPFTGCTPIPGARPQFLGVINLRGEIRAVASLSKLLDLSESANSSSSAVLFLRSATGAVGLKVDAIEGFVEIRVDEFIASPRGRCLKGFASGTLMLIDAEAALKEIYESEGSIE